MGKALGVLRTKTAASGASRVLTDKALLKRVLVVYERLYPMAKEWDAINREFVVQRVFPSIDAEGSARSSSAEQGYAHGYHGAWRALRDVPRFRNLPRSRVVFRQGQIAAYRGVAAGLQELLTKLAGAP